MRTSRGTSEMLVTVPGWVLFVGLSTFGPEASAVAQTHTSTARLVNISTRAQVGTGSDMLIPGFVVAGAGTETLLIRAIGPGLNAFGVSNALTRPSLALFNNAGASIATNTGWGTNPNSTQIADTASKVGAFALAAGSGDCALLVSLPPGAYTVQVSGVDDSTGVALAEIYEVSALGTRLANVSTRAQVGTEAGILIPGFVISGSGLEYLQVRAVAPSLGLFGVNGTLQGPVLSVVNSAGTTIATNTGWGSAVNPVETAAVASTVGAFALPGGSADCALGVSLSPGAYTMPIMGANNTTGIALGEVYETKPMLLVNPPAVGATSFSGYAYSIDRASTKIVVYNLTNQWYVQPTSSAPFTNIATDGSWRTSTSVWSKLAVLAVNPAVYSPAATMTINPALGGPGVLASAVYPSAPISVQFSGYDWGIRVTGNASPSHRFGPGPNYWSDDGSVVSVDSIGRLHLKISQLQGLWHAGGVFLQKSLGYGTYTVQVDSALDKLDRNTVACPLFIYAGDTQEYDNEYSGSGGLIPSPYNAHFAVQPSSVSGNKARYVQPAVKQWTTQMEWRQDHLTFRSWQGWSAVPAAADIISQWTYTGPNLFAPGQENVRINLWLLNGAAPMSGVGDEMVVKSFAFQP
jgi:hypothetical protein